MRVVHLVIGGEVGGGQAIALRLAQAARERGHETSVVSPSPGPFLELVEAAGIRAEVVPLGRAARLDGVRLLARRLRAERAELLHTHTLFAGNLLGRLAARLAGVPVLAHMHTENYFRRQAVVEPAQRALDNATARLCRRIVAVSESTRRALEAQGYPGERLVVVHNGVDLPDGAGGGLRGELGIDPDAFVVGHIGRLSPYKGQRELLEALATLPADVHAVLIGIDHESGGSYRQLLETEAARLGLGSRVHFVGYREQAGDLIADFDLLALPSWIEGLPLVVLEAMARAKPVVASRVGGLPELVAEGSTGLLVPPRDVAALAAALAGLTGDRERARRLGEAGRARVVAEFSAQAMADRFLEIYDELAA
jgi:glycosyltransferase involved in cell wall biosynthesis